MEGHTIKPKSENDFGIAFTLESSEARKICTLNSREEKRLEKVRKSLEKQRKAEEKRLLKAQKEAVSNYFDSRRRNSTGKIDVRDRLTTNTVSQVWMTSPQDQVSLRSGNWGPQNLITKKNSSKHKGKHTRKVGFDYSHTASNSFSVFPDMQRILASEGTFVQRSRSWSSEASRPKFCFLTNKVRNDEIKEKQPNYSAQRSFIHENSPEVDENLEKRKETPLSEVLPPVVLPPLHSQKNKTLTEKRLVTLKKKDQLGKEELWNGLEDCRYIRTHYFKNK